ncbi:MAG: asparaginase [Desulfovibrionaceae bacterium]|nr:asparaginase [Desulfovibrionaceae bacterium]MBF0515228.1 asparaginase [Desulfovibrionaceae bacterium]
MNKLFVWCLSIFATFAVLAAGLPARAQNAPLPTVVLIATGGTIAMKYDAEKKGPVPAISGEDLVATVPDIAKVAKIEVENISNVPSAHMDPPRWLELEKAVSAALAKPAVAGVIVSHGTDTLEETAYFLDLAVKSDKPVVLIGAQRSASESDFDGPRNLLNAARICVAPEAKNKGAMLVMNGQINAAREVTKTHTSDVETFKSGDFGFLGVADEDRVVFSRAPLRRQHVAVKQDALPRVDIVTTYGGSDDTQIKAATAAGAKGIVLEALGWGNVNPGTYEAVKAAIAKGVAVAVSTRVYNGRVLPHYGYVGGGKTLQDAGAVFCDNLSPQKARLLLMLALQYTQKTPELQAYFDK